MPCAIVFDLDDTLYLERDYCLSGFRAVATAFAGRLGPPPDSMAAMQRELDAGNRAHVFDALLKQERLDSDRALLDAMVRTYHDHVPQIALCPDADRVLSRLRAAGARLGLLSDGRIGTQRLKIDSLRLANRLDAILITDELGREFWKPHPRGFEELARRLGAAPQDGTYVADNAAKDFLAPNTLGWRTVQIRRPGALYAHEPPPSHGAPKHILTSLDELT